MKVALAQIAPVLGDIEANIRLHVQSINLAMENLADLVVFPELSLTGYACSFQAGISKAELASALEKFQQLSNEGKIAIAIGMPSRTSAGWRISMTLLQPGKKASTYSKNHLHDDEKTFFIEGDKQIIFDLAGYKFAPAICYESLLFAHAKRAVELGAQFYLCSVAKPQEDMERAFNHYSKIAVLFSVPVLMVNSVAQCDSFQSCGMSAVWDKNGDLLDKIPQNKPGILTFDTKTNAANLIEF
ncbi:MAG: carbon-nitrogen hydrolase family protein [Bacteroidota bacterium]